MKSKWPHEMTRDEWLEARRFGVGASEIAGLCGLAPPGWLTPFDIWAEKLGLAPPRPETFRMRRGRHDEPFVLSEYAAVTGRAVESVGLRIFSNPAYPFAYCTPDAFEIDSGDGVEAKSIGAFSPSGEWGEEETDRIPAHYLAQVTWQMGVCGKDLWHVAALFHDGVRVYTVRFDPVFFKAMYDRAEKFWNDHVKTEKPPEPMVGNAVEYYLKTRYPEARTPLRQASDEEIAGANALFAVRTRIKEFEVVEASYENQLKADIGEAEGIQWDGGKITHRLVTPGPKPDWKAVAQALNPSTELLAANTPEPKPYRRFVLTINEEKPSPGGTGGEKEPA